MQARLSGGGAVACAGLLICALLPRPLAAGISGEDPAFAQELRFPLAIEADLAGPSTIEQLLAAPLRRSHTALDPVQASVAAEDLHEPDASQPRTAPVPLPNAVYGFSLGALAAYICARRFRR